MFPPIPGVHVGAQPGKDDTTCDVATRYQYSSRPAEISAKEMSAAPTFLGVHYLSTTESPFCVLGGTPGLKLELEEMPDLGGGKASQFCLRISLDDSAQDEATMVILPRRKEPRESSESAYRARMLGPYRVRVLRCAVIQDARNRTSKWASDMQQSTGYAAAVAVDSPTLPAPWTSVLRDVNQDGEHTGMVLAPMEAGDEVVSLWLSSKHSSHQHVTLGEHDDDSLHVELLSSLLVLPEVEQVTAPENGRWKDAVSINSTDTWLWSVSLEVLRLGGLESHKHLPVNWARSKSWSGVLRPEARTKTRKGRLMSAGDYTVEVRERIATLSEFGILCRAGGEGDESGARCDRATGACRIGEWTDREMEREAEERKFAELDAYRKHIAAQLAADEARQRQIDGYEEDFDGSGSETEEDALEAGGAGDAAGLRECQDGALVAEGPGSRREGDAAGCGGTRAIRTSYPIMDFSVLIHISRIGTKDAEEDAWAALLGDED